MKKILAATFAIVLVGGIAALLFKGGGSSTHPAPADRSPFHSVIVRDGAIIATLPATPTWLVIVGTSEPRRSEPEESFTLHAGSVIKLSQRHSSYQVTAQMIPAAGLTIESTFDARSFGDCVTKKEFFIAAK